MPSEPAETGTTLYDNAKLNFALDVVMAREGMTAGEIAREAGITEPILSILRKHGRAGPSVQLHLIDFLNMTPGVFRLPPPARPPAPAEAPAAEAAA